MTNLDLGLEPIASETANKANIFLKKDFQHYLNLSGMHRNQLSSPRLSLAPGSTNALNGIEKSLIDEIQDRIDIADPAQRAVSAIYKSMDNCTQTMLKPYRSILLGLYVEEKTIMEVAIETSLADSTIKKKKQPALCEFADRLIYWKKEFKCEFLPDLRVWQTKKQEN